MRFVFYSTNSNYFDESTYKITNIPEWKSQWQLFTQKYPEHQFIAVTQKPGMFLLDLESESQNSHIKILESDDSNTIAEYIISLQPDYAIALSFWVTPFDWLCIKDSIIGEKLKEKGIKTICHSVETSMICFDKNKTHEFLEKNNFNVAKALFIDHDLYFCGGNRKEIKYNIYKEAVLAQVKKLHFPVVIKDTVGLSSYGMQVLNTYGEAVNYLNSKKHSSNRIIEEYIPGEQFGCEIYGANGKYTVLPPFKFSVNQYGITSPKQGIKLGPVEDPYYRTDELYEQMKELAAKLNLNGVAQVDLVFSNNKWFVIEINPRLSGMTTTYGASLQKSVYQMVLDYCVFGCEDKKLMPALNMKLPLKSKTELQQLAQNPDIKFLSQTEDLLAKQDRELGYCEAIVTASSFDKLQSIFGELLPELKTKYPSFHNSSEK